MSCNNEHEEHAVPGPVHYWQYGKIPGQEELTNAVAHAADEHGLIPDALSYTKELKPLEDIYQGGSPHGVLQSAIDARADCGTAFSALDAFFVNGMPCDGIVDCTKDDADEFRFEMTDGIHAQYWTCNGGDTAPFYAIRKCAMEGMLSATSLTLSMPGNMHCILAS